MPPALAAELEREMRFDLATIAMAGAWAFNVHAIPVDAVAAWDGHGLVDTVAMEPALNVEMMEVTEMMSTAMSTDIDELVGSDTLDLPQDGSSVRVGGFDQHHATASTSDEIALPSSGHNYYLALIPLGVVGFTILQGWRTWQMQRRLDRRAARAGHQRWQPSESVQHKR